MALHILDSLQFVQVHRERDSTDILLLLKLCIYSSISCLFVMGISLCAENVVFILI